MSKTHHPRQEQLLLRIHRGLYSIRVHQTRKSFRPHRANASAYIGAGVTTEAAALEGSVVLLEIGTAQSLGRLACCATDFFRSHVAGEGTFFILRTRIS